MDIFRYLKISMKILLTLDKSLYLKIKQNSKRQNYISPQEYIRNVLRNNVKEGELEKVGKDIKRGIKKMIS